jgi:RecB family exonuclease
MFTRYDGNLAELAGTSRRMGHAFEQGRASATVVERWATCGFLFLLRDVLRVRATRRPEDEWTASALDRGSVVHLILERFYRALDGAQRLRGNDRIGPADHDYLDAVAAEVFSDLEADGRTGHPLAWENVRAAILTDLHELVERDQGWRDAEGLVPRRFEQSFGRPDDEQTWPAVAVRLMDGRSVTFGGIIDRVDVDPAGRRALIIDYKTGGSAAYRELQQDPVAGGRRLQLAVYAQAMRNAIRARGDDADAWQLEAEFRFVTAKGGFQRIGVPDGPDLEARLGQVLQWAADGISGGAFPSVPGARDRRSFANCTYCDYDRVGHTARDEAWERKRNLLPMLDTVVP